MAFCPLLVLACLHLAYARNAEIISPDFPIIELSDAGNFIKRSPSHLYLSRSIQIPEGMRDAMHGVKMGISNDICDNAKDNLEIDWDGSPVNHTCYHPKNPLPVVKHINPTEECNVPKNFIPKHVCMTEKIIYSNPLPTFGNHRPLWPVYGEYVFVPPQRWLHNLEHGAVVMLYHPCAEPLEVDRLRQLVKGCLRRHVITPYALLSIERPLALVAWGCKLEMNHVNEQTVRNFIKQKALHGPEYQLAKQGQYQYKLLKVANTPKGSTFRDLTLCPSK